MNQREPDLLIGEWLRDELDAVPEPTRALAEALDAATVTPQRRGRLSWFREMLGLGAASIQHGSLDRPEVVLTPASAGAAGPGVMGRQGAVSLPIVLAILAVAVAVIGAMAWMTVGPGRVLIGGTTPDQLLRPIDQTGPQRVIVVDPIDGHYATLAGAVAEAESGERIELYPGIHYAEVVITEDIEIVGVGERDSVVVAPLPLAEGEELTDRLRVLITLQDSDASLRGFTLQGSDNGTAIVVDGGSPMLEDLLIDPEGDMSTSGPNQPRESLSVIGGASPTIRASELTSIAGVGDGSKPVFERALFQPGCLLIDGEGTSATVRDVDFIESDCPGFSISVSAGAHAAISASPITNAPGNSGIRVANPGSSADITGTGITGGYVGLTVGSGAAVTFQRSNAQEGDIGIVVQDAELVLLNGAVIGNAIGLQVSGESFLEVSDTDICDNGTNLDLSGGAQVPLDPVAKNRVCVDGTSELATGAGS